MKKPEKKEKRLMKIMRKNPVFVIPLFIILLLILALIVGETYAYFKLTVLGNKKYLVGVDELTLTLDESTTPKNIAIESPSPTSDAEGVLFEPYTFSLTNDNQIPVGYALFIDDVEMTDESKRIDDSKVRYQLIKNGEETIGSLNTLGANPLRVLDLGKMEVGNKNSYSLRFWIDENAGTEIAGQIFSVRLRVVVTQPEAIEKGEYQRGNPMVITEQSTTKLTTTDLESLITARVGSTASSKAAEKALTLTPQLLDKAYPIGSIYKSESNVDPSELFGGVWERYAEGRKLVGVSESKEQYKTAGTLGGNENVHNVDISHTHKYDKTTAGTYDTVIEHTHDYSKTTSASYSTVIAHTHKYSKATSGSYSTVIYHNHSGTSLVAAIGAVDDDGSALGYAYTSAPSGLPVGTSGAYMFTHNTNYHWGAEAIRNWNHGTKIYGNLGYRGSTSGSVSFGYTDTATTSTGSSSGSATLAYTTATTSSTGSSSGSIKLSYTPTSTGNINENLSINGQDPYITIYMWKRVS